MMPEWHQLDSSTTMSEQQESAKKKTLKSSSRLFWFSTGLYGTRLESNLQPLDLQSDLHLLPEKLRTAVPGPVTQWPSGRMLDSRGAAGLSLTGVTALCP